MSNGTAGGSARGLMNNNGRTRVALVATTAGVLASAGLLLNCGGEEQTAQAPAEKAEVASPVKKRDAGRIIAQLQGDVRQDLPEAVTAMEESIARVNEQLLVPWRDAWQKGNAEGLVALVAPTASLPDLAAGLGSAWRSVGGVAEHKRELAQVSGAEAVKAMAAGYLGQFSKVEYVAFDIHKVIPAAGQEKTYGAMTLEVVMDVRGQTADGGRRQDRGTLTLDVASQGESWKITGGKAGTVESLVAARAGFTEATEAMGLSAIPLYPRLEAIRRGGYAITLGDFDGDDVQDLFVGGWGSSNLFRGGADGKFTDVTKATGLAGLDRVKAAALADLNNDGTKDLVISRFVDDQKDDVLVFMNKGGVFERNAKAVVKATEYDRAMPLTVADFNADGFVDLYVGFPGARDFTYLDSTPNTKGTQGFFINNGDGTFKDMTVESGLGPVGEKAGLAAYPHASVKADFDGDGLVDLMVADDRRGPSLIYKNTGDGKFKEISGDMGIVNHAWAMGIAVGDYDLDGLPDIYLSNIDFLAAKRIDPMLPEDLGMFQGNRLYRNAGNGRFDDVTEKAGVGWAGEGAAGSGWFDYDNDGDLDLYVLNGLWTGPGENDLSSLFVRAYAAELLAEVKDPEGVKRAMDVDAISLRNPGFNNMIMKALTEFKGNISTPEVPGKSQIPTLSLGGHQRNVLFRNNGDGTFTDVGYLMGVDTLDDGYMPSFGDLNKDGKVDLLVRACDPGTTQLPYPSLRVYQNGVDGGAGLAILLQGDGVKSNRDAVGAKIEVHAGGKVQTREIDTVIGASQSEMAAFFGLGKAAAASKVVVHWPSGKVETFNNVAAGRVKIVEGTGTVQTAMK